MYSVVQNIGFGFRRALSIDYRTLALFRVCLALLLIQDLLLRSRDFTAFFTDKGIISRSVAERWFPDASWSLYFINGTGFFAALLVAVALIAALCLLFGYRTRLAAIVSWIMLLSLQHRTSILSAGSDDLLRLLLFWSMFLPLGTRFSFDAAMQKLRHKSVDESCFSIASIAILMQAMYVYWVGALLKTGPEWTIDYSAVYYALSAEHYASSLGMWVRESFGFLLPLLTRFVYILELYGPLLMLAPVALLWLRLPVLLALIGMHIGFLMFLNVGHFPLISIASLLLFLPPEVWRWLQGRFVKSSSEPMQIFYDQDCDFCLKTVRLLETMLVLPKVSIAPAQPDPVAGPLLAQHDSWVVMTAAGENLLEWRALRHVVAQSPLFSFFSWPMLLFSDEGAGKRIYHWIGDRRIGFGSVTSVLLPWQEGATGKDLNLFWKLVVGVLFVFVLYINLEPVSQNRLPEQSQITKNIKFGLGLWQKWNMFAPYPVRWTQWPVFTGYTEDGREVDIFRHRWGTPTRVKPAHVLAEYSNFRWRKYYGRLYLKKYAYMRRQYVRFECEQWNRSVTVPEDRISSIHLEMANEATLLDPEQEFALVENMGVYNCDR